METIFTVMALLPMAALIGPYMVMKGPFDLIRKFGFDRTFVAAIGLVAVGFKRNKN